MNRYHPLVQLTLVRFREFIREPEALFWVFIFPILLAAGLGIAFRNRPAEVLQIAAVTPQLAAPLRAEKLLAADVTQTIDSPNLWRTLPHTLDYEEIGRLKVERDFLARRSGH